MAKGSQLSQLKSSLSSAGVLQNSQSGKKRKRSGSSQETRQSKIRKAASLEDIGQKFNPFDVKVTKLKHDLGGRKIKGISGKPAQSKQAGIEQRKGTLLKELKLKGRAGGIVDRRFGENDPTMSLEERMLERFTKEKQRSSKISAFNLEDEADLTHYGQSLSKLDDFDDVGLDMDDEEEESGGNIDGAAVRRAHFSGFSDDEDDEQENDPERKKSKAEVMAEVIAKSKHYKASRQMEKEQEDNVRHELDADFANLRDLIFAPDPSSSGSNRVPLGVGREVNTIPVEVQDDYDTHVRELAFDKRAKAKDRTKTEEELALEEKEALEAAERKRRKRMLGEDSDSDDDATNKRRKGGDDLDDDFVDDTWNELGAGLGEEAATEEPDSSEEDAEKSDSEDESGEDSSDESEDDESGEQQTLVTASKKTKPSAFHPPDSLPFTFPCPASHEELVEILEPVPHKDVATVVQRIRTLHHPSLSPDNKSKLRILTTVLIDHILYITSPSILSTTSFSIVSALIPHISSLTRSFPIPSAVHFMQKLNIMHKNLKRGLSKDPLDPQAKTFPGVSELAFLRLTGFIWSTSDLNHAVISPARVLMGAYLGLCRIRSVGDIARGLFLCTLFLQYETESKRYVPEAINFIVNSILHLAPHGYKDVSSLPGCFPSPDFNSDLCRKLKIRKQGTSGSAISEKLDLIELLSSSSEIDLEKSKVDLLALAFDLLGRYATMYKSLPAFIELFDPIREVLESINDKVIGNEALLTRKANVLETINNLLKHSRQSRKPLLLQAHKPIPIPSYVPKFESSSSSYLRRQDPDHEKNEASKLRHQYKQEKKGAIRELRKDARFLTAVQQEEIYAKDKAYNNRMKRVFGEIEGERAEEKKMEREKSKDKRRAGRK